MAGNKITRDDVIESKVFEIGTDYAKDIENAVEANVKWLNSFNAIKSVAVEMAGLEKQFKSVSNNSQFVKAKEKEVQITKRANAEIKEQERLSRALAAAQAKFYSTQTGVNKELQKTRFETNELNKKAKEYAILSSKLSTEYQKQEIKLRNLRKAYKDLALRQELTGNLTQKEVAEMQRLRAEATKLDNALRKVDGNVGQFQRNVGNYDSALKGLGSTARSLVGAFGVTSGVAIFAQIVKGSIQNVRDFDSGLKDVQKTTGLTGDDITQLGDDIVLLSRKLQTVGTKSLLEYATVAGQLGVKGRDNILAFTESLAKLETASDITGEEGGASIARLLTLVDGGVENIADFGDEIVKLGNNFAATESEILGNATAIAQNTGIYKLGRQAVLAYATATKAVGIESEITGSTIGKTLGLIEKALRTGKGLQEITALTGKSVEELQRQFSEDAGSVFTDLVKGLNEVDKAGGSVNASLEQLGITAVRDQRVIGSLATAGFDTLARSIQDVTNASGALGEEFATASSKLNNQINRLSISWDNFILSIEKGDGVLSKYAINSVSDLADIFDNLSASMDKNIGYWDKFKLANDSFSKGFSLFVTFGLLPANKALDEQSQKIRDMISESKKAKIATDEQREAFKAQYGSLAPLTEAQTRYIKNLKDINILTGGGAMEDGTDAFGAASNKVSDLQKSISDLNAEILEMEKTDIKGIRAKQVKVKALQDELDAILGVSRATKQAAKEQKDYNFETNKFINEQKIKFLKEFAEDEKRDFDLRQTALKAQADLEIDLLDYVTTEKLKKIKKGSDEERDILVRSEAEKQAIIKRFEDSTDNLSIDKIKARAEEQAAIQEKLLNEALLAENERFNNTLSQYDDLEQATIAHEKRVADIKKRFAVEALEAQIKSIEALLDTEKLSADERIRLENQIAAAKLAISEINKETYKNEGKERVMTEEEVAQAIIDLSQELAYAIGDIFKNLSDRRIEQYQREIERSDERYDKLLQDETLYEEDRKRLEETKERAREKLERKIVQEKRKQARLDKALAAVQIGINTAVNISKVIPNPILIALVAALGAAQLAAVAATPIPQYAKGTDNHKGGLALVGEERPEVIQEPNKAPYIVSGPSILDLPKGTKVTPSLEEYEQLMRASILSSVTSSNKKMNAFQTSQLFDANNEKLRKEMELTRKAVSKIKQNVIFRGVKSPDINYQLWRMSNTNWRS